MKRIISLLLALVLLVSMACTAFAEEPGQTAEPFINQIYGGGGKGDTPISNSFIELYNPAGADIDLSAYSLVYGDKTLALSGTIPASGSYLIVGAEEVTTDEFLTYDLPEADLICDWAINNKSYTIKLMKGEAEIDSVTAGDSAATKISKQKSLKRNSDGSYSLVVWEKTSADVNEAYVAANAPRNSKGEFGKVHGAEAGTDPAPVPEPEPEPSYTPVVTGDTRVKGYFNGTGAIDIELAGRYNSGAMNADGGSLEIVAYNPKNGYAYAVSGVKGKLIAVDINVSPEGEKAAELAGTEYDVKKLISGFAYGDMTSVAVSLDGSRIAVAIQAENYADNGAVALFSCKSDGSLELLSTVIVGVQPDMVTFANNNTILTADEGEPREGANAADPKGSVTIVTVGADNALSANSVYFDSFDEKRSDLTAAGVLVQKGRNPSEDFEPEYIAVSGNTAFVSLQEANAVAVLDIAAGAFTGVYPLGFCDYGATKVDLQKNDKIELNNYENVSGIRMPDGISVANIGGKTYLLTANEGDSRADWSGMNNEYENKTSPTGNVTLDKKVVWFNSTMWDGLDESKAYVFGGRSFSIYEATANGLTLVYDSGSNFEAVTADKLPEYFNASNDKISIDNRSGKKGPEPESVVTGIFGEKTLAFIALERIGGIMVYDITEPANAKLVNYINSREFDAAIQGDVSPEGLCFVAASDSKSGKALLLAACEVSGTLAVYQLDCAHTPEELYSKDETGHWKNCTACGEKLDFGAHISDGGVVTTAPTATTNGLRTYSCTVCGYVIKTEVISQTGNPQIPSRPNYPANNTNQSNNQTATTSKNTFTKEITAEAKTEGNSVTISWDKVDNADKYIVYRYKDGKYVRVKETTDLSVTFSKLKNGTTYEYMVKYSVGGKVSPDKYADKFTVTVNYKPVVKATAGKNSARLSWKAVPGAEKYAVYKYVNDKAVKLAETEKTAVTIRKLKSGKEYSYIVRAYVDGKWTEMKMSDVVTVKAK